MRRVGEELGNTPAVARASYVSPAVIEQWRDGRTLERFRPRAAAHRLGPRHRALAEEAALLSLLAPGASAGRVRTETAAGRQGVAGPPVAHVQAA